MTRLRQLLHFIAPLLLIGLGAVAAPSLRPGLGGLPYADAGGTGVTFRVWAPNATSVVVAGTFNGWNTTAHPLFAEGTNGCWSADVATAQPGDAYKYVLDGGTWRTDPRVRTFDGSEFQNTLVLTAGVAAAQAFASTGWTDRAFYELHIGTFRDPDPNDALPGTFYDAIGGLDHLADLGITDVQLMPVTEFRTSRSWGYNPAYPLAVEDTYGGREGLRAFTAACHARGLRVHMDVVHNHWDAGGNLWAFDAASPTNLGGIYFYGDTGRCCTAWGPRPDYERPEVRALILDSVREYLDLGCDGFRWDAVSQMYYSASTFIPAATSLTREASALVRARGGTMVAENAANVSPASFDAEWSYRVHSVLADQLGRQSEMIMNVGAISDALRATGFTNIIFLENHDTAGLLNSWALRWPTRVGTNGQSLAEVKARARVGAVIAFTCRGTPLLFQGQEFGVTNLWHDDRPLDWSDPAAAQNKAFYRDLIRVRRNLDGVTASLLTTQQTVTMYGRPSGLDVHRGGNSNRVVVAVNLSQTGAVHWSMTFPQAGWWHVALSSDDTAYGGGGAGLRSIYVTNTNDLDLVVPGITAVVYTRGLPPDRDADGDGLTNAQEVDLGTDPVDPASAAVFGALRRAGGGLQFDVTIAPGGPRWLEASSNLVDWSPVWQTNVATGAPLTLTLPESTETQRFFRVR